jgi:peptidoglycan/LPS O-acetylase OafA/YrhL
VFLSTIIVWLTGYSGIRHASPGKVAFWVFSQISLFQFYNPDFMREYGVGVLNGSLWTISVELQFYMLVPLLYKFIINYMPISKVNKRIFMLLALFIALNRFYYFTLDGFGNTLPHKLFSVTFLPWFYMFLIGVFFQINFKRIVDLIGGKAIYVAPIYLTFAMVLSKTIKWQAGNVIDPLMFIFMAAGIFSIAYSYRKAAHKLLGRNDPSYGMYIWHMPVVNLLLIFGLSGSFTWLLAAVGLTAALSAASWFIVEKPALRLKKKTLNPVMTSFSNSLLFAARTIRTRSS